MIHSEWNHLISWLVLYQRCRRACATFSLVLLSATFSLVLLNRFWQVKAELGRPVNQLGRGRDETPISTDPIWRYHYQARYFRHVLYCLHLVKTIYFRAGLLAQSYAFRLQSRRSSPSIYYILYTVFAIRYTISSPPQIRRDSAPSTLHHLNVVPNVVCGGELIV